MVWIPDGIADASFSGQQPQCAANHFRCRRRASAAGLATLRPVATVALEIRKGQKLVGIVEAGTADGLIIWIRTEQNERKMVHFHDCDSVQLIGDEW